jgi:Brp/Blh family beta-carotene 15,15'-monooxygenase
MSFWKVLGLYVLLLLTVGIIFLTIPKITVLFLLLLSSYHFGSDFVFKVKNIVPPLGIGWMVLSTLFFINTTETQVIFQELLDIQLSDSLIQTNFYISAVLGTSLLLYNALRDRNYLFLISTVVLFLGFWSTDLITGFTAYFIFWHSIPSVIEQSVDHTWTEKLNVEAIKNFFRRSFLYYAISLVGVILYFYLKSQTISSGLTLVILMVLSVPHVLVIDLFKRDAD